MKSKSTTERSPFDTVKLVLSVLVLFGAIGLFYYYDGEVPQLYRVLGLLGAVAVAVLIAATTATGRGIWAFARESRTELRKVVWPTRQETVQTTLIVMVMVLIVGIFLWLLDMALFEIFDLLMNMRG